MTAFCVNVTYVAGTRHAVLVYGDPGVYSGRAKGPPAGLRPPRVSIERSQVSRVSTLLTRSCCLHTTSILSSKSSSTGESMLSSTIKGAL